MVNRMDRLTTGENIQSMHSTFTMEQCLVLFLSPLNWMELTPIFWRLKAFFFLGFWDVLGPHGTYAFCSCHEFMRASALRAVARNQDQTCVDWLDWAVVEVPGIPVCCTTPFTVSRWSWRTGCQIWQTIFGIYIRNMWSKIWAYM